MNAVPRFSPGNLVKARGREWVVLPGSDSDKLNLRPLSGSEADSQTLLPDVELEPVTPATFPAPDGSRIGPQDEAQLMRDAFRLALRRGAGPFRSAGRVVFEPKAYQLVPLMMAMKLDAVRLLIADDVGIGKTIEGGLIARELLDRGEIERIAVLCPPHLVDQWVQQLTSKFLIPAVAVTASSAGRLERALLQSDSIFRAHPFTVVSLDYIKSDVRRDEFVRACPEFVIVDEAHTCVAADDRTHLRYRLLERISADVARHLVLLTATPHSGIANAFHNLLGLLDRQLVNLGTAAGAAREDLRTRLSAHYVQRRRIDIDAWKEGGLFPTREEAEEAYLLAGEHQSFLELTLDYCTDVVEKAGSDERRQRLAFWGTLALMRCVGSSPAAALKALNTRAKGAEIDIEALFDGSEEVLGSDDTEPTAPEDGDLAALVDLARRLVERPNEDPKLAALLRRLKPMLKEGFSSIVFCRYISTAQWVGRALQKALGGMRVEVVHGEMPSDERRTRIEGMDDGEQKILVATDCLSEGIDLQDIFDAVVHYDLCWNPTRHQQREGRVDRFGQQKSVVRSLTIYGKNNPVDGVVIEVIIRKANVIRKETGVPVAFPEEDREMSAALFRTMLHRRKDKSFGAQGEFDFGATPEARKIEAAWRNASEREKANRTIFAQRSLKPEEVMVEWAKTVDVLGDGRDTARFFERSLRRLGVPFVKDSQGYRLDAAKLPEAIRSRIEDEGLGEKIRLRVEGGSRDHLHRNHPLVGAIAELLVENSLDPLSDAHRSAILARTGAWATSQVTKPTLVVLTRVRHCLTTTSLAAGQRLLLAEETDALAFEPTGDAPVLVGADAARLIESPAAHKTGDVAKARQITASLSRLDEMSAAIERRALERAKVLEGDHMRIRSASKAAGTVRVAPVSPVDIVGVYSLMPALD
jgi:superfamily II DNA or RNA helicase